MTNEIKLLTAFIESQGYEVETIIKVAHSDFSLRKALFDRYNQQEPITTTDYKVTKKKAAPLTFDKTGDITAIPPEAFIEAAKRDIAKGIDIRSCNSSLQSLMKLLTEINND